MKIKKNTLWILYSLVLIGIGIYFGNNNYNSLVNIFLFPFNFAGNGIRYLLLENTFTFILGFCLFVFLTALPILYLLYRFKKRRVLSWEIILLSLLSIINIFVLYFFINPSIVTNNFASLYLASGYSKLQFAGASIYYSVLFLYLGLRIVNYKENKLTTLITKILLYGLSVIITSNIILNSIHSIVISFNNLNIQTLQVVEIVLKYVFESILNVAAIYILIRLQRNYIRLNDGTISYSSTIKETRKINKFALIFIGVAIVIILLFVFINIIRSSTNIKIMNLPVFELSIFIITWIVSKYLLKLNKINVNGINQ